MEELFEEMERYACEHDIPIMQKEGLLFFQNLVQKNHIQCILEIGSAIGYSALKLASLDPHIHVVTIERDDDRYEQAVMNVKKSGLESQITLIHADALECEIEGNFDCIFIDAAKAQYVRFFEKYEKHLSKEGVIISDNLSFHGYVDHPEKEMSRNLRQLVRKIRRYIDFLENHEDYDTLFINEGDGLAISRKKKTNVIK